MVREGQPHQDEPTTKEPLAKPPPVFFAHLPPNSATHSKEDAEETEYGQSVDRRCGRRVGDVGVRGRARVCEGKRCEDQNQCAAGLTCSAHFCVAKTSVYRKQQTLRERRGRSPTNE